MKNINIINRKAKFSYEFIETYVAGLMLKGTEIKSIRAGNANLSDSYCILKKGELWVKNLYIAEYEKGNQFNHDTTRMRKLLMTSREIVKLSKKLKESGLTLIPYKLFISDRGLAKMEIALAKGKKTHDKRQSIKEREENRAIKRINKHRR